MINAVDLFAGGARGWDIHDTELGLYTRGYESDDTAVATSLAAGFATVAADISMVQAEQAELLKGSPPCQTFSAAGKGAGRRALEDVYLAMDHLHQTGDLEYSRFSDVRTGLVLEPLRWALEVHRDGRPYRAIVLEQVPPVLPVWQRMGKVLEALGYSVAVGNLHAEQYGVPQTRKRAVLVARLDAEAMLPTPTHSKYYSHNPAKLDNGVEKWVSMAEALGWGLEWRPSPTITGGGTETGGAEPIAKLSRYSSDPGWMRRNSGPGAARDPRPVDAPSYTIRAQGSGSHPSGVEWVHNRPATTVQGDARIWPPGHKVNADDRRRLGTEADERYGDRAGTEAVRVTVQEASILQSLPADHPWQGSKTQQYLQVGNAIPALLAKRILECVL